MRSELVAIDLETTGLNIETDMIIEIGAVKFRNGSIIAEFSQLIDPGFIIPQETTHITGIRQDDLRGQPRLIDITPQLEAFVGNAPLIAHNAAFDVSFLRRFNMFKANESYDTLELVAMLFPQLASYGLGRVAALMGITLDDAHRALADARATAEVYTRLFDKALTIPKPLLLEIAQYGETFGWNLTPFFRAAAFDSAHQDTPVRPRQPYVAAGVPLRINRGAPVLPAPDVRHVLEAGGQLSVIMPAFEAREEQLLMLEAVQAAVTDQAHLLVEAGTGTGKSLAYLLPTVAWALENEQRVVVATNTINLQEQLLANDVPLVQAALGKPFIATVMKGRSNYLCPRRLDAARRRRPATLDEVRVVAKLLIWSQESDSGDRGQINLRGSENTLWSRMSAEDEGCTQQQCETLMQGVCPLHKAQRRADTAHLVIANHALLVSDAASENGVLPPYQCAVIDEAHQFEEAVTNGLAIRIEQTQIVRRLQDLGDVTHGMMGDLLHMARGKVSEKQALKLESFARMVGESATDITTRVKSLFVQINEWIRHIRHEGNHPLRIAQPERKHQSFGSVRASAKPLYEDLALLSEAMANLASFLGRLTEAHIPNHDDHQNSALSSARYFSQLQASLAEFLDAPTDATIFWIETGNQPDYTSLNLAPLQVGNLLQQALWDRTATVIMTSATLETGDSFDFIRRRLGAQDARTLKVGSPFDYRSSTLLYVPRDIPEHNRPGYQQAVEAGIVDLASALEGRVLVLFTSFSHLRETVTNVQPRLARAGITVFDQAYGGNRDALLEGFRVTPRAVLMGTRSFWQGIDVPGDSLQGLIIVKLPFTVPSDPIFAARAELYRDPFDEYSVPDAILRFRQGFGRLIRSDTDRGIVGVFDSRVLTKKYGQRFLDALPECTTSYGSVTDIGNAARQWLK